MAARYLAALLALAPYAQATPSLTAVASSSAVEWSAQTIKPVAVPPSQNWDGIDGSWSSFTLRVGTPAQYVRVFASWLSYQILVIHPQGCPTPDNGCIAQRGGVFRSNESSSWEQVGLYDLNFEQNLPLGGNAYFGYDQVGLGNKGEDGPTLPNVTVGALAVNQYYIGYLGVNPKPTNWTTFSEGAPSFLTQLMTGGGVPSVSFGYTAGAAYRFTKVLASLTLGGYDSSKFDNTSTVQFTFAPDNSRDTMVAIQAINSTSKSTNGETALLSDPIYALVDATVAEMYLPLQVCQAFEKAFGLVYDSKTQLYLVNSTLHDSLLERDATVSFTLAQGTSGGPTVTIDLPYAAFDQTAKPPYQGLTNSTTYFPLRRAANTTEYTLGRVFMQEAYISVDYERAVFNLSKVAWVQNAASTLVAIPGPEGSRYTATSSVTFMTPGSKPPVAAIAGGVVAATLLTVFAIGFFFWRRRRQNKTAKALARQNSGKSTGESSTGDTVVNEANPYEKAELDGGQVQHRLKHQNSTLTSTTAVGTPTTPSAGYGTYNSSTTGGTWTTSPISPGGGHVAGTFAGEKDGAEIHELPGDMPSNLADSKQITEKDMMRHRERAINGYDPVEDQKRRDEERRKEESRTRQAPVESSLAVREATEGEGGNRRFSFVEGEDTL